MIHKDARMGAWQFSAEFERRREVQIGPPWMAPPLGPVVWVSSDNWSWKDKEHPAHAAWVKAQEPPQPDPADAWIAAELLELKTIKCEKSRHKGVLKPPTYDIRRGHPKTGNCREGSLMKILVGESPMYGKLTGMNDGLLTLKLVEVPGHPTSVGMEYQAKPDMVQLIAMPGPDGWYHHDGGKPPDFLKSNHRLHMVAVNGEVSMEPDGVEAEQFVWSGDSLHRAIRVSKWRYA